MPYEPPVRKDKIWLYWGEDQDVSRFEREEYTGKRAVRALQTYVQRKRRGGNRNLKTDPIYFVLIKYESERFGLIDATVADLYQLGVLSENMTKKTFFTSERKPYVD